MMPGTHLDEQTLLAYVEGDFPESERSAAVEHLATCASCAEQMRLLKGGRDALRAAPLLELTAERRRAMVAALPERRDRLAPFRARFGPAAAAAAALVLVAGLVALTTLAGGNGESGADEEGAGGGGEAALESAPESDQGAAGGATTEAQSRAQALADEFGPPVRRVQGTVEDVIRLLQRNGVPAVRRDGSVLAAGDSDDVLEILAGRPGGRVPVYVK
jgi:anti-sigma factor RsiW